MAQKSNQYIKWKEEAERKLAQEIRKVQQNLPTLVKTHSPLDTYVGEQFVVKVIPWFKDSIVMTNIVLFVGSLLALFNPAVTADLFSGDPVKMLTVIGVLVTAVINLVLKFFFSKNPVTVVKS